MPDPLPLHWPRTTPWSERAAGTHYRVSRSDGADGARYSAWHGPLLREQEKYASRMPDLLGIYPSADAARAACAADLAAHPERYLLPPHLEPELPGGGSE
jgi:hypothetical protein